jgi:hypothetical protein
LFFLLTYSERIVVAVEEEGSASDECSYLHLEGQTCFQTPRATEVFITDFAACEIGEKHR